MRQPEPRPTGPFGTVSGRDMFQMPQNASNASDAQDAPTAHIWRWFWRI